MRRIRLIVEYKGTNYVGWQLQNNGTSVQELLGRAVYDVTKERPTLHGSGRTDSGVHALAQVVHFDTNSRIPADKFPFALNVSLPYDIRVKYADEVDPNFHARFDVVRKHYRYIVRNCSHASAFGCDTELHLHGNVDFEMLCRLSQKILGEHDFNAFKAEGASVKSTIREIYRSEWKKDGTRLIYDICGSGFMYNMVRILVGTMLDSARGRLPENAIETALLSGKRSDAGATAPAHGLYMARVEYDGFDTAPYTDY